MSNKPPQARAGDLPPVERDRIAHFLARYPDVSPSQRTQIMAFLKKGPHLDVGMLTGNQAIKSQLDAFMADHKSEFSLKYREIAAVVGAIIGAALIFYFLWEGLR